MEHSFKLYSYFRSSCSYRVRIALNHKGLPVEYVPVHLLQDGGQQYSASYLSQNPMGEVPTLQVFNNQGELIATLSQSVAILEYLEECFPQAALMPKDAVARATVRKIVQGVNSAIQPVQNLKVMKHLGKQFDIPMDQAKVWGAYWIERGFQGLEKILVASAGKYAFGEEVTLADVLLVPQHYNAVRFKIDMSAFPTIERVCKNANLLDAFQKAHPSVQPDTPEDLRP